MGGDQPRAPLCRRWWVQPKPSTSTHPSSPPHANFTSSLAIQARRHQEHAVFFCISYHSEPVMQLTIPHRNHVTCFNPPAHTLVTTSRTFTPRLSSTAGKIGQYLPHELGSSSKGSLIKKLGFLCPDRPPRLLYSGAPNLGPRGFVIFSCP